MLMSPFFVKQCVLAIKKNDYFSLTYIMLLNAWFVHLNDFGLQERVNSNLICKLKKTC